MNNNVKKFLSFSRSERIAIIAIISVIIIMMVTKLLIINIEKICYITCFFCNS